MAEIQKKQTLQKKIHLPRVFRIIGKLFLLAVILYLGLNVLSTIVQIEYEVILNSVEPSNFTLTDSHFGHEGSAGMLSLDRTYKVSGTRESVLKELELKLAKSGYVLQKTGYYKGGYGYNEYEALGHIYNAYLIDIRLFPVVNNPREFDYNPNAEVNEVDLLLSG